MTGADGLKYLHILLLVAWLGIDVGVFSSSFVIRRRGLSGQTRVVLRQLMRGLDLAPRLSLILMVPVGVGLAHLTGTGATNVDPLVLWLVAAGAVIWCAALLWSYRQVDPLGNVVRPGKRASVRLIGRSDVGLRLAVASLFLVTGAASVLGDGPWQAAPVAWKATIFGVVILLGLWIRLGSMSFTPALRTVVLDGETDAELARMDRAMRRVYPAVLGIWLALFVMAGIAVFF